MVPLPSVSPDLPQSSETPSATCVISDEVVEQFEKLRKSNASNAGLILSCDKKSLTVVVDEIIEDQTIEEIAEDLPESPRYIIYSYKWQREDGRVQYPMLFIYYVPPSNPFLNMMYSSTRTLLTSKFENMKYIECQRSDDIDEEWLIQHLKGRVTR